MGRRAHRGPWCAPDPPRGPQDDHPNHSAWGDGFFPLGIPCQGAPRKRDSKGKNQGGGSGGTPVRTITYRYDLRFIEFLACFVLKRSRKHGSILRNIFIVMTTHMPWGGIVPRSKSPSGAKRGVSLYSKPFQLGGAWPSKRAPSTLQVNSPTPAIITSYT